LRFSRTGMNVSGTKKTRRSVSTKIQMHIT
jgi:hypothetical protein